MASISSLLSYQVSRLLVVCWLVPLLTVAIQLLGDAVRIIMWLGTVEFSLNVILIIHYTKETTRRLDNMTENRCKTETYHITRTIVVIVTLTVVLKTPFIINILITLTTDDFHLQFYIIGNLICALGAVLNPAIFGCIVPIRTHVKRLLSRPRVVHPEDGYSREVMQNRYLETCEYLDANPHDHSLDNNDNNNFVRSVTTNVLSHIQGEKQQRGKRRSATSASTVGHSRMADSKF